MVLEELQYQDGEFGVSSEGRRYVLKALEPSGGQGDARAGECQGRGGREEKPVAMGRIKLSREN